MNATVVASIIGALTAVLTATLAAAFTRRRLMDEVHSELRRDLARKQIAACEAIWSTLGPASFSLGSGRIINAVDGAFTVDKDAALAMAQALTEVFYSSHGLFLSRQVRMALFRLRDHLCDDLVEATADSNRIYKTKAEKFRSKVTSVRMALRAEIAVEDLAAARDIAKRDLESTL